MQRIVVTATARADVTETWTVELPDDYPVITDVDDLVLDDLINVSTHVACENDVSNEEDREVVSFHYEGA